MRSTTAREVILASHLGRPLKDKKKADEKGLPFDPAKYTPPPRLRVLAANARAAGGFVAW